MTIKAMMKENNQLREQMTPENKDYYEDIIVHFRDSQADKTQREQFLLQLAQQILEVQQKGITARQLLGIEADEYSRMQIANLTTRKPLTSLQYYVMIPWIALSIFFFMESLIGFVEHWLNGNPSTFNQVSLLSLIIIAGGSILLIEAVTKVFNRASEEKQHVSHRLNLKAVVVYIIVLVVIMMLGYTFRNIFPIFTIQPWLSLLISIVGLFGWLILFKRK